MKAKRRVCALLFSALMIWQGFMIVNAEGAEGAPDAVTSSVKEAGKENATATLESGATVGNDTTTQGGKGSGSGPTALGAPPSEESAEQDSVTVTQAESVSQTATDNGAPSMVPAAASVAAEDTAEAQHQGTLVYGIIQDANIYLDGNNPVDPVEDGQDIYRTTLLQFRANLNFNEQTLHAGDVTEIKLPTALRSDDTKFEIKGTLGDVVANGVYDGEHNTIRITFNKNIENRINKDGSFFFKMQMNPATQSTDKLTLDIKDGKNNTLTSRTVNYTAKFEEKPKTFFKDMVRKKDGRVIQKIKVNGVDRYFVRYQVTFDAAHFKKPDGKTADEGGYKGVKFTDELGENLRLFDPKKELPKLSEEEEKLYTPTMQKGVWKTIDGANNFKYWSLIGEGGPNGEPKREDLTPEYDKENGKENDKKFTFDLRNIGEKEGVVLEYYAEIVGKIPAKDDKYTNTASLTSVEGGLGNPTVKREFTINDAGGVVNQTEKPPTSGNPPTPNNPPTPGNPPTPNTPPTPGNPPTPNNPPTPGTPPIPGTPPTTPPTPGQVLGARRYPEGRGGQEQEKPAVLGTRRGRGSADTSDHSASDIHWLLFGFGTAGLFAICINELVGLEKLLHRIKSRR